MNQIGEIKKTAEKNNGIIKASELAGLGITRYGIRQLMDENVLERVRHGYYRMIESAEELGEEALVAQLFPDGIISMYMGYCCR